MGKGQLLEKRGTEHSWQEMIPRKKGCQLFEEQKEGSLAGEGDQREKWYKVRLGGRQGLDYVGPYEPWYSKSNPDI